MSRTITAALVALSIGSAHAADSDAFIVGHGARSCAAWTEDQNDDVSAIADGAWLDGYLSASNVFDGAAGDHVDLPDAAARRAWVSNYCQANPLTPIYRAAAAFMIQLHMRKAGIY